MMTFKAVLERDCDWIRRVNGKDLCRLVHYFQVVPAVYVNHPEEPQHRERRRVFVDVTGHAESETGYPKDDEDRRQYLYWFARKALERGDDGVVISATFVAQNQIKLGNVPDRHQPFDYDAPAPKMGFNT
jgi:hypothetical protein